MDTKQTETPDDSERITITLHDKSGKLVFGGELITGTLSESDSE